MGILVLQHHDLHRPGRLGLTLRDHGFRLDVIRPDRGDALPADLDDVDAVVSLGGPQQTHEGHHWMEKEKVVLKAAVEADLAVIAIGLGAQLLAEALGGEVADMDSPEAGFVDVDILPAGQTEPIFAGITWQSSQFMKHTRQITKLPPGARAIARSRRCLHQAFRYAMRVYAFQYHFECDRKMIDALLGDAQALLHRSGVTSQEFEAQAQASYEMFARLGDRLALNLVNFAIPRVGSAIRS